MIVSIGIAQATAPEDGHLKRHGAPTESQPQGHPDLDLLPLWAALAGKASGPVSVSWSHLWGTPKAVYGILSKATGDSEAAAREFLSSQAALFKLDAALTGFSLASSRETPMGRVYVFSQRPDGVPVYGGEVKIHFDRAGHVVGLTNTTVPTAKLPMVFPSLKPEQAIQTAHGQIPPGLSDKEEPVEGPRPSAKLVIYGNTGTPALAWVCKRRSRATPPVRPYDHLSPSRLARSMLPSPGHLRRLLSLRNRPKRHPAAHPCPTARRSR